MVNIRSALPLGSAKKLILHRQCISHSRGATYLIKVQGKCKARSTFGRLARPRMQSRARSSYAEPQPSLAEHFL